MLFAWSVGLQGNKRPALAREHVDLRWGQVPVPAPLALDELHLTPEFAMHRSTVLLLLALAPQVACKGKVCGPYVSMKLPGVTEISRCDPSPDIPGGIDGVTTASWPEFVKALSASGFELGRDAKSTYGEAKSIQYFRKDGSTYYMLVDLQPRPKGGGSYFGIKPGEPQKWLPEASWEKLASAREDRKALIERLRGVSAIVEASPKAPKQCDGSLVALDPTLAKTANRVLLNLDSGGFGDPKAPRESRGPESFPKEREDNGNHSQYNEQVYRLVPERQQLDELAERRVVPVIKMTKYQAAKVDHDPESKSPLNLFRGGVAAFDVAVVDLKERRVLCRSSAWAESSKHLKVSKTTVRRGDGSIASEYVNSNEDLDLANNISRAAFATLATRNPAFPG